MNARRPLAGVNVEWLTRDEGKAAIAALVGVDPLLARKLLPALSAEQVTEALTQARHRPADFPLPLVTPTGIQQASPIPVAQRRAARLAASGVPTVVDAGCGIGVDSWALARAGLHVIAYEIDPVTAQVARANLAGLDVEVREGDATATDLPDGILFVDPARRREHSDASGQALRVHDPSQWRPSWDWVLEQARHRPVVARIRPGHRDLPANTEWHCTSMQRRLVDATVWFDGLANTDRAASVHDGHAWHELKGPVEPSHTAKVGAYLIDPDPAIVRSGLVTNAANLVDGHLVDPDLAFITCDQLPPAWLGRAMRVLEPVTLKSVGQVCRRRGLPGVTVWSRGLGKPPQVDLPQSQHAIVVVAAIGRPRAVSAWIGEPVR